MTQETLLFFDYVNYLFSIPGSLLLFGMAVFLTIKLRVIQVRALPRFMELVQQPEELHEKNDKKINKFYALYNAMSTTLGMGSIVGPSVAIIVGGPGALFWIMAYILLGSVVKYTEVTFAIHFRTATKDGSVLGGPMQYLRFVHPYLATWYTYAMVILLASWSSLQANGLASILANVAIPQWFTGASLALFVFYILQGGAQRAGLFNSKLIPVMVTLYTTSSIAILIKNYHAIIPSLILVLKSAFSPSAAIGGFLGATTFAAFRSGVYKGALITESGIGTAAIPHSLAQVNRPTDQGILAMTSSLADCFICGVSGFLVLVTNVWHSGVFSNSLMYDVFTVSFGHYGQIILVATLFMFIIGTIMGNSLNGQQVYGTITEYKHMQLYAYAVSLIIFCGAVNEVPLVWAVMEIILPFVAIPHLLGLLYLSIKYKKVLEL